MSKRGSKKPVDPAHEKPLRGVLTQIKCRRFMQLLCCRCCHCQCPCCREPVELCCCCCDMCLAPWCCGRRQCMDFEPFDRYPCQRAINIVFVVLAFLLLLFMSVAVAYLSLRTSSSLPLLFFMFVMAASLSLYMSSGRPLVLLFVLVAVARLFSSYLPVTDDGTQPPLRHW